MYSDQRNAARNWKDGKYLPMHKCAECYTISAAELEAAAQ